MQNFVCPVRVPRFAVARTVRLAAAVATTILLPFRIASAFDAVPTFDVIEIGPEIAALAPSVTFSTTLDVNAEGDAVGRSVVLGQLTPWLRASGQLVLLPLPVERPSGDAVAISDRLPDGDVLVVGNLQTDILDEPGQAWLWRVDSSTLEVVESFELPTLPASTRTVASGINADGVVIASAWRPLPLANLPVVYEYAIDSLHAIDFPAIPTDINNAGEIVGGRFLGDLVGNATDVGVPDGSTSASLAALNDVGAAAGVLGAPYTDGAGRFINRFARWNGMWDLAIDAGAFGGASDITNDGDVLGTVAAGAAFQPALYVDAVGEIHLLTSLLASAYDGMSVFDASEINDAGVIAVSVDSGAALLVPSTGATGGPVLDVTAPADGIHVYDRRPVVIDVLAADADGVAQVDLAFSGPATSGSICSRKNRESVRCRWKTRKLASGAYTIDVAATDALGNASTTSLTATLMDSDPGVVYVGKLRLTARRGTAKARIFLYDGTGKRLREHGTIDYEWTLPDGSTVSASATTYSPGRAKLETTGSGDEEFVLRITGVTVAGMTFDPAAGTPMASAR